MPQVLNPPLKRFVSETSPYLSYEEFLDMDLEETPAEWVNGKIEWLNSMKDPLTGELIMAVSSRHSDITAFLVSILRLFVDCFHLGRIYADQLQMKTGHNLPGREPDVLFVASENNFRVKKKNIDGPADIVIEVVSEESISRDKISKLAEYEEGGVREYWIIDPLQNVCHFYRLNSEGRFDVISTDEKGIYRSEVLKGLWIDVNWFSQDPLPSSFEVIKTWGVI